MLGVVAACGTTGGPTSRPTGAAGATTGTPGTASPPRTTSSASPGTTGPTTSASPGTTTTTTNPAPLLEPGASGPAVLALQERLRALHYWLGTPDGSFGDSTEQAVYALEKVAGITPDGVVGPATRAALAAGPEPHPRSGTGPMVEVDLKLGLLMFVDDGALQWALNTSTGGGYTYSDGGVTAVADTPTGMFRIFRQVEGLVVDSLGELWRPKYFDAGFAIHGDSYVPPTPVSHGCVRVSNEAIDWIWAADLAPIGTVVWVY